MLTPKNSSDLGHYVLPPRPKGGALTFYVVYGPGPPCGGRVSLIDLHVHVAVVKLPEEELCLLMR